MSKDQVRFSEEIAILIVDDDKKLCEVLEDMLSKEEKIDITSAHDGIEAIKKIREHKFDLILTDLMMPGADGIEVLKVAKEIDRSTHVVIITGFASLETAMEAIKKGAYDYITKPFKLDEIGIVIKNACEKIRLIRENQLLIEDLEVAYRELEAIKKSRGGEVINAELSDEKNDSPLLKMQEHSGWLNSLPGDLPPSHYLRRRRSDKGHVLVELEKLGKLKERGILDEEEFRICKNRFMREM